MSFGVLQVRVVARMIVGVKCSTKLAAFLSGNDQSTLPGDQFVKVHTISFASDIPLMRDIASADRGYMHKRTIKQI